MKSASRELASNEWSVLTAHEGIVELRWLPSTESMTDGGFMASLCLLASEAEKARPHGLFVDNTEFKHSFASAPTVMAWRDAQITPRYGSAGVRKMAFLAKPGNSMAGTESMEGPAIFTTKWFDSRAEAFKWLHA